MDYKVPSQNFGDDEAVNLLFFLSQSLPAKEYEKGMGSSEQQSTSKTDGIRKTTTSQDVNLSAAFVKDTIRNYGKKQPRKCMKKTIKKDVNRKTTKKNVNRTTTQDVNRAAALLKNTVRHYELSDVINLLGECIFFESLFIWMKLSMELYKNKRCIDSLGLVGEIQFVIKNNYELLFSLLIDLPEIKSSAHYREIEGSKDVVNLAFQRASRLANNFLMTKELSNSNDIAKQIKAQHIPIESIMIPIVETFRNCLNIISDEDERSSRPWEEPFATEPKFNGKGRRELC